MTAQFIAKSIKAFGCYTATAFVLFGGLSPVHADTLNFDNPSDLPGTFGFIPNGYGGLNWDNFFYLQGALISPSGYQNGTVSSPNVAFNGGGTPADFTSSSPFTINSLYVTGAWNNGLSVQITGKLSGILQDITTVTIDSTMPTFVSLNWTNIDEIDFVSFGGTNAGFVGGPPDDLSTHFALDNLTINEPVQSVPGPTVGAGLPGLLAGFGAMLAWYRKRRAAPAAPTVGAA